MPPPAHIFLRRSPSKPAAIVVSGLNRREGGGRAHGVPEQDTASYSTPWQPVGPQPAWGACHACYHDAQVSKARQMEQKPLSKRRGLLMLMMVLDGPGEISA